VLNTLTLCHIPNHLHILSVVLLLQLGDSRDWWADLLQSVIYAHLDSQLVDRVKEDLSDNVDADNINMANKCVLWFMVNSLTCQLSDASESQLADETT